MHGQEGLVGKEASQDGQQRQDEIFFTINNNHSLQAHFGIPRHGVSEGLARLGFGTWADGQRQIYVLPRWALEGWF